MTDKAGGVESIFHEARQIGDRAEREAYLVKACAGDNTLRARIDKLLVSEAELGSFLSSSEVTQEAPSGGSGRTPSSVGAVSPSISEQPGTVIGRYKLLQQIGEGGFGVVYMAEQREPVQRKVALKIIKLGMDTRDVIARFEQERQALAMMDHPNIAKVLDAGATNTGRPYFVMELVKGVPITEYCDKQNMSFRDRLKLFIQVCSAVQHAHQKGIIHRDIKPSNVLVTHVDDKPVPKVIDFGIAKATQQKLTEHTMFTQFGQFMGTPAYMSPEQADPIGLDIDTRSDIYSLGVLLYELLTGATPFEARTLRAAALDEVKRIIREQDPPKPSTRLSTIGEDLPNVAKRRGVEPKKLGTILRGDLDWIIMKALEKDRTRRYESATDLARDIERHLGQEPVTAGPPSASYRMRKFVRRNRTAVSAATIASATIIGFAATMAVQARRIAAERDRANHEREMSDRVVEFQAEMLRDIRPRKLGENIATDLHDRVNAVLVADGAADDERQNALNSFDSTLSKVNLTDTARTVLDANILAPAAKAIEEQFANQPLVEARLQYVLAKTYAILGLPEKALPHSERALELQRKELGDEHRDTVQTRIRKAMILWDLSRPAESSDILRGAIASAERQLGPEDPDTLMAKLCLAVADADLQKKGDTRKAYEDLLVVQERVLGPDHETVASTLQNLGIVLINQQKYEQAVPVLERALKIYHEQLGPDEPGTLSTTQMLARGYVNLGRADEAISLQLDALQRTEKTNGARHPDTIKAVSTLADLYKDQGRYKEAEPFAQKAFELNRELLGPSHRSTLKSMTTMGIILGLLGRHDEAEVYHVGAYDRAKSTLGPDHQDTMDKLNNLAVHYWFIGQYQQALERFAENLAAMERRHGKDHVETTYAMGNLAIVYNRLGRVDEAQAILEKVLAIRTKAYGFDHRLTLEVRASLAALLFDKGEFEKVEQMYIDLLAAEKKVLGPEHSFTLEATYNLALVIEKLGRKEEAARLMVEALEGRRRVVGANHPETIDSVGELARMRHEAGQTEEARKLFTEAIAARRAAASADGASPAQLNACALLLLTCVIEDFRNPKEALEYAQKANEATNHSDAVYLNTLARALYDTGEKERAVETQRKAMALLPPESPARADYEERLTEYAGKTSS